MRTVVKIPFIEEISSAETYVGLFKHVYNRSLEFVHLCP